MACSVQIDTSTRARARRGSRVLGWSAWRAHAHVLPGLHGRRRRDKTPVARRRSSVKLPDSPQTLTAAYGAARRGELQLPFHAVLLPDCRHEPWAKELRLHHHQVPALHLQPGVRGEQAPPPPFRQYPVLRGAVTECVTSALRVTPSFASLS